MKKIFYLLLSFMLVTATTKANKVYVSGYLKDSLGTLLPNKTVYIYTDSLVGGGAICMISHTRTTNSVGMFYDTLNCTSAFISQVYFQTINCNNTYLFKTVTPLLDSSNGHYEAYCNFMLCTNSIVTPTCTAKFTNTKQNLFASFYSGTSTTGASDSIINRTWTFGDSTATLTGNIVNPTHTYTRPGTYNVCLKITSIKGCTNTTCSTITITATTATCKASFNTSIAKKTASFTSNSNAGGGTNTIASYLWKFGVTSATSFLGSSTAASPSFTFPANGTYTVCLKITTSNGCTSDTCRVITINDTTVAPVVRKCKANFGFNVSGKKVFLNSTSTTGDTTDVITSSVWQLNGASFSGSSLTYTFGSNGIYKICLSITTSKGCTSDTCKTIVINDSTPAPTPCKANFNATVSKKTASFTNTSTSGSVVSSIVSYMWSFKKIAGGLVSTVGTSSLANPSFTFASNGTYSICLAITTSDSCYSDTCKTITINDTTVVNPVTCKAMFTSTFLQALSVKFNSNTSVPSNKDSIISREWNFGDNNSTPILKGNVIEPIRTYLAAGTYTVCLKTTTAKGCTNTYCNSVYVAVNAVSKCVATFTTNTTGFKTFQFNSGLSAVGNNDSIKSRTWNFGDGTSGSGFNPTHIYPNNGIYNVCLTITTLKNCSNTFCSYLSVNDTTKPTSNSSIKLITLFPNPVLTEVLIDVWSNSSNTVATIEVYDVFGIRKYQKLNNVLLGGDNFIRLNLSTLPKGSYILKVTSTKGVDSKAFYKA